MPRATWPQLKADVCQELDLDPTDHTRLSDRAQQLKDLLPRVDRLLDRSEGIRIEDGELIVPMDDQVYPTAAWRGPASGIWGLNMNGCCCRISEPVMLE